MNKAEVDLLDDIHKHLRKQIIDHIKEDADIVLPNHNNHSCCIYKFMRIPDPSPSEIMFLLMAREKGLNESVELAKRFKWDYERVTKWLTELVNGVGRGTKDVMIINDIQEHKRSAE